MEDMLLKALSESGPAGLIAIALIIVVRMMLKHSKEQLDSERESHGEEVDKVLKTHNETVSRVVAAFTVTTTKLDDSTKDLTREVVALKEHLRGVS